ncbi:TPA: DedA family protein [Candidatus Micrarchaeota archaeon]|nr:DedA family protein [Candidatus Micrarchaeota archaeon]
MASLDPITLLAQTESYFFEALKPVILAYGGLGIAFAMFLESSFVPIPSELILITAGLFFDPVTVAFWGAIGSTLGAIVGYYIGFYGGRPAVRKIGPYLFITQERVDRAEKKFKEWGPKAIFISRLIPFIPFKVFSITSGILRFDLPPFVIMTFLGTIPRAFILALIGNYIIQYKTKFLIVLAVAVLIGIAGYVIKKKIEEHRKNQPKAKLPKKTK